MRRWPRLLITGLGLGLAGAAQAAPADYLCDGGLAMTTLFTPREARVTLGQQTWELARVRDKGDARYVDKATGISLVLKRSQAELERKGEPALKCKLQQRALRPEALNGTGGGAAR